MDIEIETMRCVIEIGEIDKDGHIFLGMAYDYETNYTFLTKSDAIQIIEFLQNQINP
jgi:hypothetical protein